MILWIQDKIRDFLGITEIQLGIAEIQRQIESLRADTQRDLSDQDVDLQRIALALSDLLENFNMDPVVEVQQELKKRVYGGDPMLGG